MTSKQAPGFLPWFEDLNNSPKEMTQYYTHTRTQCLANCWLLVSRNKEEIHAVPTCGGLRQFGGFRHERPEMQQVNFPPATAPHTKQREDAHKFWVKDNMVKKHSGLPGDLVATLTKLSA